MSGNYCSEEYLQTVNYVRTGTFTFSFLACLVVSVLWICCACRYKGRWCQCNHFYMADRLLFYLLIIATANSIFCIAQVITLVQDKSSHTFIGFCATVAFLTTLTDSSMLLISIIIAIHLMLIHSKKMSSWLEDEKKGKSFWLEVTYLFVVLFGSLIIAGIPLLCFLSEVNCYGYDPVGQQCWMAGKDENCNQITAGFAMEIVLYYIPAIVVVVLSVPAVVLIIAVCCTRKPERKKDLQTASQSETPRPSWIPMTMLTCYLVCFSLINVVSFTFRIRDVPTASIVIASIYSMWGLIPAIFVFILIIRQLIKKPTREGYEDFEGSNQVET